MVVALKNKKEIRPACGKLSAPQPHRSTGPQPHRSTGPQVHSPTAPQAHRPTGPPSHPFHFVKICNEDQSFQTLLFQTRGLLSGLFSGLSVQFTAGNELVN